MLKISYYFINKEVWEGLQRAGDTTEFRIGYLEVSQNHFSLKTTMMLLTSCHFYLVTTAPISMFSALITFTMKVVQ